MADLAGVKKYYDWAAWGLRTVKPRHLMSWARDRAICSTLRALHLDVIHQARCLSAATSDEGNPHQASMVASDLCTRFHAAVSTLLALEPNQLHCCIKLIAPKQSDEDNDKLCTWVRSTPSDGRPIELNPSDDFHAIEKNSVWSAFYGINDGATVWQRTNCFVCNNLVKHGNRFKCDREGWSEYYQSTLVFPINRATSPDGSSADRLGFLAFDSPETGSFRGMPDIYDYRDEPHKFRDALLKSSAFHLGAICADLLGTSLAFNTQRPIGNFLDRSDHVTATPEPPRLAGPGVHAE